MQLLSQINIPRKNGEAAVQLLQGDLSALPEEHAVDILVVSAFPNDYNALPGSLFLALQNKGLSVKDLAKNKKMDLLPQLGCWLSTDLTKEEQDLFNFKRVLCFEPQHQSKEPQEVVGNIFRCINTFAFDDDNDSIAMPLLASGYQKVPMDKMLPALVDNAVFWLDNGLPLKYIKLVLYRTEQIATALQIFENAKQQYPGTALPQNAPKESGKIVAESPVVLPSAAISEPEKKSPHIVSPAAVTEPEKRQAPVLPKVSETYDYFISYSHVQTKEVFEFVKAVKEKDDKINIFYDRSSIPPGGLWLRKISEAIQHSKYVICILTPEYSNSDVCWDEFQCAKVMELRSRKSMIKTINFIRDDNMPPIMAIYSYIDCTEKDLQKLREAASQLIEN